MWHMCFGNSNITLLDHVFSVNFLSVKHPHICTVKCGSVLDTPVKEMYFKRNMELQQLMWLFYLKYKLEHPN